MNRWAAFALLTQEILESRGAHRQGGRAAKTENGFIADFALAMGGGQINAGSARRSERIARYNKSLEMAAELINDGRYLAPFACHAGRGPHS